MPGFERSRLIEGGFTLIEVLVVMLILGILTAIAVPIYIGQQDKARDTTTLNDLVLAKAALVAYSHAHDGALTDDPDELTDYGFVRSTDVTLADISITLGSNAFCIEASARADSYFSVTEASGVRPERCP